MGRWLKQIDDVPETKLTKLTELGFVGFVSPDSAHIHENNSCKLNLVAFVIRCCTGFPVNAKQVIDYLLSVNDEEDIINGDIPSEAIRLHIELWIKAGMPHYSGKTKTARE